MAPPTPPKKKRFQPHGAAKRGPAPALVIAELRWGLQDHLLDLSGQIWSTHHASLVVPKPLKNELSIKKLTVGGELQHLKHPKILWTWMEIMIMTVGGGLHHLTTSQSIAEVEMDENGQYNPLEELPGLHVSQPASG